MRLANNVILGAPASPPAPRHQSAGRMPALPGRLNLWLLCVALVFPFVSFAADSNKISVLIVDGMNNHDWERGTRLLKTILEDSGLFAVDISTSPANRDTAAPEWTKWRP